ncbi:hypothetical protein BSNT_08243 [Bacillus subtilis subsp. natto BEST195]|nr:hypothetical protein BSNT_08243 [Bacillus subtilis subsp. natto BEST195]
MLHTACVADIIWHFLHFPHLFSIILPYDYEYSNKKPAVLLRENCRLFGAFYWPGTEFSALTAPAP